jgi:hypothetical protein
MRLESAFTESQQEARLKPTALESVALIPKCAECEAVWLPTDEERWHACLAGDDLD